MAPKIHTVCGIAGAGKTSHGISLVQQKLREGLRWDEIGYCSFSRAAAGEAARRASEICGEDVARLQRHGWFGTLHALALRSIGVDRRAILDPESSDGRKFISEACGTAPDARERGTLGERIANALSAWDLHRARLGCPPPTYSGFIPECRPGHSCHYGVINASAVAGLGCVSVKPDEPDQQFRPAAHEIPEFYMAKLFPELFKSYIGDKFNYDNAAHENFVFNHENREVASSFSENLYRTQETVVTDHVVWSGLKHDVSEHELRNHQSGHKLRQAGRSVPVICEEFRIVIEAYENAKRLVGRLDFSDILLLFLGLRFEISGESIELAKTYTSGAIPNSVQCWIVDEYQDCSPILACVSQKLSEDAQSVFFLGDSYQVVYGFSGSSGTLMRLHEVVAKRNGTNTLLNVSHRNCIEVIEWGEQILSEDESYESRQPQSEAWEDGEVGVFREGSVGLVKWEDFLGYMPELACSDVMVLSRAWFSLLPVKDRLDSLGIPWRSCQEKQSSRWECPAKIAYVVCMRALAEGEAISEQDWRRITDTLPQKMDGKELFVRGTKSKWAKIACSNRPALTIAELSQWGATFDFFEFVMDGKWRREMFLLLDNAISQFGIEIVRNPRIRLGSVHSVKGLEARNVFCLSASTERCSGADADVQEEICLKYVAVTRSSKNYRLVVNVNDIARSRPQFWAAPKGFWEFDPDPPKGHFSQVRREQDEDGSTDSGFDSALDDFEFRI